MLFEIHAAETVDSPSLQSSVIKFRNNEPTNAYDLARKAIREDGFQWKSLTENDFLFLSALFFNCGLISKQAAVHRLAVKYLANPGLLAILHAWDLSFRGHYFESRDRLENLAETAPEHHVPLIVAMQSYNYSLMGWDKTAKQYHEKATEIAGENPMAWYVISRASARRTDWQLAIQEGTQTCQLAPHWTRARAALSDSLMATGQYEAAKGIIAATKNDIKTCGPDYSRTCYSQIHGEIETAISSLRSFLSDWPLKNDFTYHAATKLTLLLMQHQDLDAAKLVISSYDLEQFEDLLKVASDDNGKVSSKYISMPLVSQTRNHCVPTVAAMVAGSQGFDADPSEFAEGMGTRHGTQLWQMVDYMKTLGFAAICIKPEPEAVIALLDQDIPLIGQLKGMFMGHVDCVCGYDQYLDLFHLRDPMHWQGSQIKSEDLKLRYEGTSSLWAFVAKDRISQITVRPEWVNFEGIALTDLARAVAQGELSAAEQSFAKIAEDHPARALANQHAHLVAVTEGQYQESLKKLVDQFNVEIKKEEPEIQFAQVEAMLQFLNEDNADDMIQLVKSNADKFSNFFIKYVEAQCLFAKTEWNEALEAYENLCRKSPSLDNLWTSLSQVQQQLGLHEEAEKSLEIAMEVAPDSDSIHRRKIGSQESEIGFDEKLSHVRKMIEDHPYSPATRLTLASVMEDSDDGAEYESCLLDCIKFYPRYTYPYNTLASWYLGQNRSDKAKQILMAGRTLIGEEEMPLWEFELSELEDSNDDKKDTKDSQVEDLTQENEFDYRTRFQKLWSKVVEDFDKSKQEMEFSDEFKELLHMDQNRKIHWWDSARFLSMRYANLMADQSPRYTKQPGQRALDLRELLPNEMPGITESYVKTVLDSIDMPRTPHDCLVVLLEWVDATTPRREQFPDLQFLRAYLLEQLDRLNESETVLHQIVENFPANQAALYRLAQIAEQQADLKAAEEFYGKCLSVSPGHYGSREAVVRLAAQTGKPTLQFQKKLLSTFPYNANYIYNVAMDLAKNESIPAGDRFYLENESRMPSDKFHPLRARMLLETDRHEEAIHHLDQNDNDNDSKLDYTSMWVRVDYFMHKDDFPGAVNVLEQMETEWPYDQDLIDQLVRLKREMNMLEAKLYCRKKLQEGCPVFVVAYVFLQNESNADELAIEILNQVPIDSRDSVAIQLVEAIQQSAEPPEQIKLMQFCQERMPHLHGIRNTLAYTLSMIGRNEESVNVAKALLDEQPDNPHWLELIGHCYEGFDNDKCLEYLQQAFEVTGRADTLVQIGRNQSSKQLAQSESTFWEVLDLDPYNTVAMTNLYWVNNVKIPRLFDHILAALNAGGAADLQCEYFLVTAKIVAEHLAQPLPESWFTASILRAREIAESGGFADEPEQLGSALTQWWRCWESDEQAESNRQTISRAYSETWISQRPANFFVENAICMEPEEMEMLFDYLTKMRGAVSNLYDSLPVRIVEEVQEMEEAMSLGRWDDATIFANRAISKFDDSVDRSTRLSVVQRLIDAENCGGILDRVGRVIPFDLTTDQVGQIIGGLFGVAAVAIFYVLSNLLDLDTVFSLTLSVLPFALLIGAYFLVRYQNSKTRLLEILEKRGEPHQWNSVSENDKEMADAQHEITTEEHDLVGV